MESLVPFVLHILTGAVKAAPQAMVVIEAIEKFAADFRAGEMGAATDTESQD